MLTPKNCFTRNGLILPFFIYFVCVCVVLNVCTLLIHLFIPLVFLFFLKRTFCRGFARFLSLVGFFCGGSRMVFSKMPFLFSFFLLQQIDHQIIKQSAECRMK